MTGRVECKECGTGPVQQGADQLARTHNKIHHRGKKTAKAIPA